MAPLAPWIHPCEGCKYTAFYSKKFLIIVPDLLRLKAPAAEKNVSCETSSSELDEVTAVASYSCRHCMIIPNKLQNSNHSENSTDFACLWNCPVFAVVFVKCPHACSIFLALTWDPMEGSDVINSIFSAPFIEHFPVISPTEETPALSAGGPAGAAVQLRGARIWLGSARHVGAPRSRHRLSTVASAVWARKEDRVPQVGNSTVGSAKWSNEMPCTGSRCLKTINREVIFAEAWNAYKWAESEQGWRNRGGGGTVPLGPQKFHLLGGTMRDPIFFF